MYELILFLGIAGYIVRFGQKLSKAEKHLDDTSSFIAAARREINKKG